MPCSDHEHHTRVQGYAGLFGYPTFFAATAPTGQSIQHAAEQLHSYMLAKKHQVRSDRSLGLLFDEGRLIVAVVYVNDRPTERPDLEALGNSMGLQSARARRSSTKPPGKDRRQGK